MQGGYLKEFISQPDPWTNQTQSNWSTKNSKPLNSG